MDHQSTLPPTKLEYYDNMWKFHSQATLLSFSQVDEDGRQSIVLDSTIFHPQGGGQPSDTGLITVPNSSITFVVEDVRSKEGIVYHYGHVDSVNGNEVEGSFLRGTVVHLHVDEPRRTLNSRLHSAGHLLDVSVRNVGWQHLKPGKAYHFPDGPYVEYRGTVPQTELGNKVEELERDANVLVSRGGKNDANFHDYVPALLCKFLLIGGIVHIQAPWKIWAAVLPFEKAAEVCGGFLPEYIAKGSCPRIVRLGENLGCPCGGTHVHDISEIGTMKISQIRIKKGMTKVFYSIST